MSLSKNLIKLTHFLAFIGEILSNHTQVFKIDFFLVFSKLKNKLTMWFSYSSTLND